MSLRPACACALVLLALCLSIAAVDRSPASAAGATMPFTELGAAGTAGTLWRADIFRDCQQIRRCWTNRYGRRRCGPALRCRTCKWVKRCARATGCRWEQSCRWGPPVAPTQQ